MISHDRRLRVASIVLAGWALNGSAPVASFAASRDGVIVETPLAGPQTAEAGAWRTKTQAVFDPATRTLMRRMYVVWDAMPARDLDFVWIPTTLSEDSAGKINGTGRLIWRLKGQPSYERGSTFAEYRGAMKDGRAEGQGVYVDASGLTYRGEWKNGLMDGYGTLMLPSGDTYLGQMRAGKASGAGRYIDVTGEIFDGRFVDGERDGPGATTLPNRNSYRSVWARGQETEDSRQLRLAQAGGGRTPAVSDDIRIGINIDRSKVRDDDLAYAAKSTGSTLTVEPDNSRLMEMWKGNGEIELLDSEEGFAAWYGVFSLVRARLPPPTLVFEVQNRSAAPISVNGAYLAVESSVTDRQPAIQLHGAQIECGAPFEFRPKFKVENFGWSTAEHAVAHFAFANPNINNRPEAFDRTKNVGNVEQVTTLDFEQDLQAAGVNVAALKAKAAAGFVCTSKAPATCLAQVKSSGLFGSLAAQIDLMNTNILVSAVGTLDYAWQDAKGGQHHQSSPFNMRLAIAHLKTEAECGEGGEADAIAVKPQLFRLDQSNYKMPIAFQRSIPAGRTAQFTLAVGAAKSSEHDFTVVLQLADGREIASRPVSLTYYLPSWFPKQ